VKKAILVGVVVAAILLAVAYARWFKNPTFGERYELMTKEQISVNTAFRFLRQSFDKPMSAVLSEGRGAVEAHFDGPEDQDVSAVTLFDTQARARASFSAFGRAAGSPVDPPLGKFYETELCATSDDRVFSCAALFEDGVVVTGVASVGDPLREADEIEDAVRHAFMLVQGGYKTYISSQL
jgi:hypothetical protein